MSTNSLHTIIFDWAGTAIDHGSKAPILALIEAFRRHGVELQAEEARGPMGIKKDEHVRAILAMPTIVERFKDVHGRKPQESDALQIYASLEPILDQIVISRTELISGHWELVHWLREQGMCIGSTTGYTRETMEIILPLAAKQGYQPDCCVTPSEAKRGRPAPWMLWQNLEKLGCDAAWRCVKIGDTEADMEEGHRAGTWCIGYSRCGNLMELPVELAVQNLHKAGAHFVVDGPRQVKDIIKQIQLRIAHGERP